MIGGLAVFARVAVWEPMPDDDRQWVIDAMKTVPGVLGVYHLVDPSTRNRLRTTVGVDLTFRNAGTPTMSFRSCRRAIAATRARIVDALYACRTRLEGRPFPLSDEVGATPAPVPGPAVQRLQR